MCLYFILFYKITITLTKPKLQEGWRTPTNTPNTVPTVQETKTTNKMENESKHIWSHNSLTKRPRKGRTWRWYVVLSKDWTAEQRVLCQWLRWGNRWKSPFPHSLYKRTCFATTPKKREPFPLYWGRRWGWSSIRKSYLPSLYKSREKGEGKAEKKKRDRREDKGGRERWREKGRSWGI